MDIQLNENEKTYLKELEKLINNKEMTHEDKLAEMKLLFEKYLIMKKTD